MSIENKIREFRADLPPSEVPDLVRKHITYGDCWMLSSGAYYELKDRVAREFKVHPAQVIVVGSAKLGFSVAPEKRYRPFCDTSDIDVALCSDDLFDDYWKDVFDYWVRTRFWLGVDDFKRYLFRGWIRPDKLPPEQSFIRSQE